MSIFDPIETQRISEWLDEGEAIAAAKALLDSKHRAHKALRSLVVQCVRQLMELAERARSNADLETAAKHCRLASELISLSGADAELAAAIEAALAEQAEEKAADLEDLGLGQQLHKDCRLQTAIERFAPVAHLPETQRFIHRIESELKTYERYCNKCQKAIEKKRYHKARQWLNKAMDLNRSGERLSDLEEAIMALKPENGKGDKSEKHRVVSVNEKGFLLDFGDPKRNTLVLFGNCQIIGSVKEHGTVSDLPISSRFLHQQHAIIVRHLRHGIMRYFLLPHPSHSKYVAVNGEQLMTPEAGFGRWHVAMEEHDNKSCSVSCTMLNNGDRIQLGQDRANHVELIFRQRTAEADEVGAETCDTAVFQVDRNTDEYSAGQAEFDPGLKVQNVMLFHQSTRIGSDQTCNDLVLTAGFAFSLELMQRGKLLRIRSTNGVFTCDGIGDEEFTDGIIRFGTTNSLSQPFLDLDAVADSLTATSNPHELNWKIVQIGE